MERTLSKKTKMVKTIRMINNGATWNEVESELGIGRTYIQRLLQKDYYKSAARYNNLLAKARENAKIKAKAAMLVRAKTEVKNVKEHVVVTETGALLKFYEPTGVKTYVPEFCQHEIRRLAAQNGRNAEKLIADKRLTWVPREKENIKVRFPKGLFKPRTIGIVALVCKLLDEGFEVELVTSSREVFELAGLQGVDAPELTIVKIN